MDYKAYLLITLICLSCAAAVVLGVSRIQKGVSNVTNNENTSTNKQITATAKSNSNQNTRSGNSQTQPVMNENNEFLKYYGNYDEFKCTANVEENEQVVQGELYVKGENLFGLLVIKENDIENSSSFMRLDDNIYVWSNLNDYGYNSKIQANAKIVNIPELQNLIRNPDLTCEDVAVETAVFEIPKDKQFIDLTGGIEDLLKDKEKICNLCEIAETPTQIAECKTQFECTQ